jgi:CP family cyanate transporter-like MFS transporter
MPHAAPEPSDTGGRVELAALLLAALALRPQLVGIGPLLPPIGADLGMSHAATGLLGTIPVACMGLFALPAARLGARYGMRIAVGACLALIAAAGLLRAAAPNGIVLLALTVPVGVGMGLCGALLPLAVKLRFARRPALGTGVYVTGIQIGAVTSSLAAAALAAAGSWRLALLVLSLAAVATAGSWLIFDDEDGVAPPLAPRVAELREVTRDGRVRVLVASFALMSMVYYGLVAWLPDAYAEHGWSEGSAAGLVAVLSLGQIPGGLLAAWLMHRRGGRAVAVNGSAAVLAVGAVGIAALPAAAWVWAAFAGLGMGILFAVVLTLPLDLGAHPTRAGAIAGVMLTGGYGTAALSPVILGGLRDATGSFHVALYGVGAVAVALLAMSFRLPRRAEPAPAAVTAEAALSGAAPAAARGR